MMKMIFSDFGFISLGRVKTVKVFDTKMNSIVANRPDGGQKTSERRRAPFTGLQVILYLRTRTDSAQPIRVVRDSCIKG